MNKRETGAVYEERAAAYLIQHGFQILEKNFYDSELGIITEGAEQDILIY